MLRACVALRAAVSTRTQEQFTVSRLANGLRVITAPDGSGTAGLGFFALNGTKFETASPAYYRRAAEAARTGHPLAVVSDTTAGADTSSTSADAADGSRSTTSNSVAAAATASGAPVTAHESNLGSAAVFESFPQRANLIYSAQEVAETIGFFGNAFRVANNKEALGVLMMLPVQHLAEGLALLNGMVLHPCIEDPHAFSEAVAIARQRYELQSRDATNFLFDMVHEAGWAGRGLGHPSVPPLEALDELTQESFVRFYKRHTTPERCVVAATGVADHDAFVADVERYLNFDDFILKDVPPLVTTSSSSSSSSSSTCVNAAAGGATATTATTSDAAPEAKGSDDKSSNTSGGVTAANPNPYTGGLRVLQNSDAPGSMIKFAEKNLTHMGLFFQGIPMRDPQYYVYSVIQTLLGGGTAFSSGGPGKGLQSKLFREVLNRQHGLHGMECITAWYSDGGLLGLYGSAPHEHARRLFDVMVEQAASIAERVTPYHLTMAANQMCSQLILLGEAREQLLSDMGFNLLVHDVIISPQETIDGVTGKGAVGDMNRMNAGAVGEGGPITLPRLRAATAQMMETPVTFAAYGEVAGLPDYEQLQSKIRKAYESMRS